MTPNHRATVTAGRSLRFGEANSHRASWPITVADGAVRTGKADYRRSVYNRRVERGPQRHDNVLLTGFEPFGSVRVNTSAEVVAALGEWCRTAILPTSYQRSAERLTELVTRVRPSALLMLGHAESLVGLRIETVGRAEVTKDAADNDGVNMFGQRHGAVDQRAVTVPVDDLARIGRESGLAVELSDNAGGYVCDSNLYRALGLPSPRPRAVGFVHVGPVVSNPETGNPANDLDSYIDAIRAMVGFLAEV